MRVNRDQIEAGFQMALYARGVGRVRDRLKDPEYWRALNPKLAISDDPFQGQAPPCPVSRADQARYVRQIREEGYFATPPFVESQDMAGLREGMMTLAAAGLPPDFACVYDEFYRVFGCLPELLTPILGEGYRMGTHGLSAFHIPPGDPAYAIFSAQPPHRDSIGPDPGILTTGMPTVLNVWVPLTDATPLNSCIYVVPAGCDPAYFTEEREPALGAVRHQDIRAVPASAGSVLCWTSHLLHWGSRSSRDARGPRISVAIYFQRADATFFPEFTVDMSAPITFHDRLRWIAASMARPEMFDCR